MARLHSGARSGLSWSADGEHIAAIDRVGPGLQPVVALIDRSSGEKRVIAQPPGGAVEVRFPTHSPDGQTIAFEVVRGARGWERRISCRPPEETFASSRPGRATQKGWLGSPGPGVYSMPAARPKRGARWGSLR